MRSSSRDCRHKDANLNRKFEAYHELKQPFAHLNYLFMRNASNTMRLYNAGAPNQRTTSFLGSARNCLKIF